MCGCEAQRVLGPKDGYKSTPSTDESQYIFYVYGSVHRWSILIIVQRDATQSNLFIILQVHSTCFGCQPHPSSSTQNCNYSLRYWSYFLCNYLPPTWPLWKELAAQKIWPVPEAVVTVLCTRDDACGWHPKHVEWTCRIINRLLCVASCWTVINVAEDIYFHIKMTWLYETQDPNGSEMWLLVDWKTAVLFATGAAFLLCSVSGHLLRPSLTWIASFSSCPSER